MASEITIRPAEELDIPKLVRLLRRSWLVTWAPELPWEAVQAFAAADPARLHAETGGTVSRLQRAETCSLEWSMPTATSSTRCTSIRPAGMAAWDRSCSVWLSGKSHLHTRLRDWKCAASTPGARFLRTPRMAGSAALSGNRMREPGRECRDAEDFLSSLQRRAVLARA